MNIVPSAYQGPNIVQKAIAYWHHDVPPTVKKVLKIAVPIFLVIAASSVGVVAAFLSPLAWAPTIAGAAMLGTFGLLVSPVTVSMYFWGDSYGNELLKAQNGIFTNAKQAAFQKYGKYCIDLDFSFIAHPKTVQELDKACHEAAEVIKACPRVKKVNLGGLVNKRVLDVLEKSKVTKLDLNLSNKLNKADTYGNNLPTKLKYLGVQTNKNMVVASKFFENAGKRCQKLKTLSCNNFNEAALEYFPDYPKLKKLQIQTEHPDKVLEKDSVMHINQMKNIEQISIIYDRKKKWEIDSLEEKRLTRYYMVDLDRPPWGDRTYQLRRRTMPF